MATDTKNGSTALMLTDDGLAAVTALAGKIAPSPLLPESLRNKPGDVLIVVLTGRELGLGPMQALRAIHVIKGRAALSAELKIGLCMRSPECEYFALVESSPEKATYETKRRGHPKPTRLSFTIQEAGAAGLLKEDSNWKKYPSTMLRWRAGSQLADAVYPHLILNLSTIEFAEEEPRPVAAVLEAAPAAVVEDLGEVDAGDVLAALREDVTAAQSLEELDALLPRLRAAPLAVRKEMKPIYAETKNRLVAAEFPGA